MDGTVSMASKIPPGYKDEDDFLADVRRRYEEAETFDTENRDQAQTDLEFLAGDQWDKADVDAREGRPCLTINRLPQFIAQVVGDIRLSPPAIRVRPAEDADKDLASIREGLIRSIENLSSAQAVYTNAAQSQIGCGIGNFRVVLEHATQDAFDRDIVIKRIENPFAVLWDPMLIEPTGRDAQYCFIDQMMKRKEFEREYPNQSASDLGEIGNRLTAQGWLSRDEVRITEYWCIKESPAEICMLQDGKVEWITKENEAELEPLILTNDRGELMRRKTKKKSVCMYIVTGHAILEGPIEYDISRLPVFRVPGWEIQTGKKKIRFGLVRFAKDPQRLLNYWRSVSAEVLALAPRQQWLIHESQVGNQDEFRKAASSGDTVLTWTGQVEPKRMEPPPVNAAVLQEAALNSQDMKDVTGLHDASLGAKSNETSGKAILARQKEGDVASYIYMDNLKSAIAECGRVINEWIPQVFDKPRTIRVLGVDDEQKVQRVNDKMDPRSIDLSKGKYDIVVDTGPSYTTKRQEASESMMAFVQAVPAAAQMVPDLIAKAQDWPMAEEIAERLKKALPPGLAEEDDKELSEEEMQARQAQAQQAQMQQQMMQQGAMLELQEKDAKVKLTHAQAAKTMAEANMPPPGQPGVDQQGLMLEYALKEQQVRKATADAAKAEAEAHIAMSQVGAPQGEPINMRKEMAETSKVEAEAHQAHIKTQADLMDLQNKPTEQDMAKKQAEKALKEPPKQPAKPKA
jgi:hypothetical protein